MKILNTNLLCNIYTHYLYRLEVEVDEVDSLSNLEETVLYEDEDSRYVYGETPEGFVTFGSIFKKASRDHAAGHRLSLRSSIFNGMFGKRCMEITLIYTQYGSKCRYTAAMTIDAIIKYIPDNFYIIEQVKTDIYSNLDEITYYITNKEDEKHNWYFKDTTYSDESIRYIRNRIFKDSLHPDLYTITSAYKRGLMDNDMLKKACSDIANSGKYSLYELNKFASDMENNFAMIKSMKFFRDKSGNISFYIEEPVTYDVNDNEEDIITCDSEDNTSNQSPNYIPYPDQFPHLTRQSIVETILDMWLSYKDIEYIKEYWLGFWKDPLKYKDSAIANMIQNDIRERMA